MEEAVHSQSFSDAPPLLSVGVWPLCTTAAPPSPPCAQYLPSSPRVKARRNRGHPRASSRPPLHHGRDTRGPQRKEAIQCVWCLEVRVRHAQWPIRARQDVKDVVVQVRNCDARESWHGVCRESMGEWMVCECVCMCV